MIESAEPKWLVEGFHGFDPPPLPEGWTDVSWRNDLAPCYEVAPGIRVYIDHPIDAEREIAGGFRFELFRYDQDAPEGWDDDSILRSDDWDAILAAARTATEERHHEPA